MELNWDAIGAIGELLGSIILIASVVYLSRQIRSSTDQASAAAERSVQQDFISIQGSLINDELAIETVRKGLTSFNRLSDKERYYFHMKIGLFVNHFEGVLRMSEKGLVSPDIVETQGDIVLTLVGSPGGMEFWSVAGGTFQNLSTTYIDERLSRGARWGSAKDLFPYFFEGDD